MKKRIQIGVMFCFAWVLTGCISVSESNVESSKQIAIMSQQAISTCGQGNVDKVTTTSFSCRANLYKP
ncbi:hypothetical protein [Undibacterium fentianense]|uniref:Lipoprotein n=1 Tax=Undibacterium fentianense TaxID=2828728 RepID=A0A941ICM8_9BURK|nr:hypothetical protein [Undibacterium fentianense]MBR7799053.1 hypothetical protein [Undibacterium fentianense]